MYVLGIESSCDETAMAIVYNGKKILSNVIASQADLHAQFGGVMPEAACRRHIEVLEITLSQTLKEAGIGLNQINLISVARGPGLIGALLIGIKFAKGLALALDIPIIGVNHVEAHLYASIMENQPAFPALGLILSGAHTTLLRIHQFGSYELLGQTADDAIGEAFDKVAVMLSLPYPGGPEIEKLAKYGDPQRYLFKPGNVKRNPYDFSFSGLKTALLYEIQGQNCKKAPPELTFQERADLAAAFQYCAFNDVINKSLLAKKEFKIESLILGGGVTANQTLRARLGKELPLKLFFPTQGLSTDNGAMIAALGYYQYQRQKGDETLSVNKSALQPLTRMPWTKE